jgi:hypothetical protein
LQARPKLLLPDLKAAAHPVLDKGHYYPHHNTYFVVSDSWDLEVLGGLMLSDFTNLFVGAYCVKMRGGCYRFQADHQQLPCATTTYFRAVTAVLDHQAAVLEDIAAGTVLAHTSPSPSSAQ